MRMGKWMGKALLLLIATAVSLGHGRLAAADWDSWYERITWSGDFRYRFENILEDKKLERDRQRVRVRLTMEAPLDDYIKTKLRLATGNTDPVSSNQSMGDAGYFTRKPIGLDVACAEYKALFENLVVIGGKMDNPFLNVGKNQLIWDGDLTLEGIAGSAKMDLIPEANLFANAGGFWIAEQSANYDPMLYGGQFGFRGAMMDIKYTLGGSYYYYQKTKGEKVFVDNSKSFGNSTKLAADGNTTYAYNYKVAEAFVELSAAVMGVPVSLYANAVKNADDEVTDRNTGYTAGFVINQSKEVMSWDLGYYARKLDKNAVVGAFCDSDFIGGGTDGLGHVVSASFVPAENVKLKLIHFNNQKYADLDKKRIGYHRTQMDVELKY